MKTLSIFFLASIFVTFTKCIEIPVSSLIVEEALTAINRLNINDANNIFLENINVKTKRNELDDDTYKACITEQRSFLECYDGENRSDEETCKIINEERCVKFFENPALYFPSCEKYDQSLTGNSFSNYKSLVANYKLLGSLLNLICVDDGNCTIAKQLINKSNLGKTQPSDLASLSEGALNSDCRRKDCVEAAIDVYENQRDILETNMEFNEEIGFTINEKDATEINNTLNLINNNLEYLQTCAQQSGAAKINASNILLISIITFILLFLI